MTPLPTHINDAVCTFCGCVCDDIRLSIARDAVAGDRIVEAANACELGRGWFLDHRRSILPTARIDGVPVTLEAALDRAAEILIAARYPLVYGLSFATCQSQRLAVAIADKIGATVDTTASVCHAPTAMAMQEVGMATCSLGEVKNRADLVVYWGSNPLASHPRHGERYAVDATGMFTPRGRADRTIVVVDVRPTPSTAAADIAILVKPRSDFEVFWALRALLKGLPISPDIEDRTGVSLETLQDLSERMKSCRFGVLFFGMGLSMSRGKHRNVQAALELTRDLNAFTRFDAKPMRGQGNITGADQVLTWQTGFPFAVNLSRGHPRYNPGEFTAHDVLSRREADAALVLAADPVNLFSQTARDHLATIPIIAIDSFDTPTMKQARVALAAATFGIETPGSVYRMDEVPLALRPALRANQPTAESLLESILARLKSTITHA